MVARSTCLGGGMADAMVSNTIDRKVMRVRLPPQAHPQFIFSPAKSEKVRSQGHCSGAFALFTLKSDMYETMK